MWRYSVEPRSSKRGDLRTILSISQVFPHVRPFRFIVRTRCHALFSAVVCSISHEPSHSGVVDYLLGRKSVGKVGVNA
jgi:hypothetical protein